MKKDKIKVLVKKPGIPKWQVREIENSLEDMQRIVGGYIETVTLADDFAVVCNEEGRVLGLPYNTQINGIDFVGDIFIVGIDGDEFTDAPKFPCSLLAKGGY